MTSSTSTAPAQPAPEASNAGRLPLKPGHCAVVGLQWGDEGKGQIVDLLTERYDLVARFNGGNNAGHSVHIGDEKFALHLLPSGITYSEKICVIGNGVVVDPSPETGLLKELKTLEARGIVPGARLRISARAHVVMPYHKVEDGLFEAAMAQGSEGGQTIGTTGRGIGPCYADKAHRSTALRMGDLLEPQKLREKLQRIVPLKNLLLGALAAKVGREFTPFDPEALAVAALGWGEALQASIGDTRRELHQAEQAGQSILFEGANAALLDIDHGTYPFVTSSTTSALGAPTGTGLAPTRLTNVLGVCKAYTSRVGSGPHPTELLNETGERIRQIGREFGTTTGRPRRCGWIDATAIRYAAQLNGLTGVVMTGLSVLSGLPELKICVGYQLRGQRIDDFLPDSDQLAEAEPIYETLRGFDAPTGDTRAYADLPEAARRYVSFIEHFVGVPVIAVCVGPKRSQVILKTA